MKATDLMLGDWVLCDGEPYQIAEISAGLLCIDAERELFATPEDLEPIPLTPEILEKNGWEKEENWWHLKEKGKTIFMVMRRWDGEFCFSVSIGVPIIQSIHQLQHALRLCGIEKGIVL